MSWKLQIERGFVKQYKKLSPTEQKQIDNKLRRLAQNPLHPSLRLKRIQGTEEFEISVNMDIRIAITFHGDTIIILLDVGHHDSLLRRRTR
jgi:mRNA-degrading endonuclease RelE of RelBE toxin-antitoxin system